MVPIILSGGSGSRLWPISRKKYPKPFCDLFHPNLFEQTIYRLLKVNSPWIITNIEMKTLTQRSLKNIQYPNLKCIYEPSIKNTLPAIALICKFFSLLNKEKEIAGIFPADHMISNLANFYTLINKAEKLAWEYPIVLIGIKPHSPETGLGYIETTKKINTKSNLLSINKIKSFVEKPSKAKASFFLKQGNYLWNAGIFIFQVQSIIKLIRKHQPQTWEIINQLKKNFSNLDYIYQNINELSFDYGILEKLNKNEIICLSHNIGWNDLGSWDKVSEVNKNAKENIKKENIKENTPKNINIIEHNGKNNFIFSQSTNKNYSLLGVNDLIIIDTQDATLVAKKNEVKNLKKITNHLHEIDRNLLLQHNFEHRPWGKFEILEDNKNHKIKKITIDPQESISYQSHKKREEHWIIISGRGKIMLNNKNKAIKKGNYIFIKKNAKHKITNTTKKDPLIFIEVQLGKSFNEEDIIRYQDKYNR